MRMCTWMFAAAAAVSSPIPPKAPSCFKSSGWVGGTLRLRSSDSTIQLQVVRRAAEVAEAHGLLATRMWKTLRPMPGPWNLPPFGFLFVLIKDSFKKEVEHKEATA
ncbi:hypothetical protein HPB47_023407, partial [Ixodes persulcatus]